jgi:hypothetical protein
VKDWELLDQAGDQQRTDKCAPSIIDAGSLGEFLPVAPFAYRDLLDRAIIPSPRNSGEGSNLGDLS